jgi:microcystin-dependent protein
MLGEIRVIAGHDAPPDWALCDGRLLAPAQNSALFALLGTEYGGNGETTFALPDLRGRVPLHAGAGPGQPIYPVGEIGQRNDFAGHAAPADGRMATPVLNFIIALRGRDPQAS